MTDEWISVKHAVPKNGEDVFIRLRGGDIKIDQYWHDNLGSGWRKSYNPLVTHWMPKEWAFL